MFFSFYLTLHLALSFRIRWLYHFPFMTYGFRALMNIQFGDEELTITTPPDGPIGEQTINVPGNEILGGFEMAGFSPRADIGNLVIWMFCMHLVSIIYLFWNKHKNKRVFVYSDK